jgi:hypothetical protein
MNSTFIENEANFDGGAFKWYGITPKFFEYHNTFINNSAIYGPDNASFASRLQIEIYDILNNKTHPIYSSLNSLDMPFIPNVAVGKNMDYDIKVKVLDFDENIVHSAQG